LLTEVKAVLGDYFISLYLHGLLAGGGFNPGRSDIDFFVANMGEHPPILSLILVFIFAIILDIGVDKNWNLKEEIR
jgi:hypothetical protein